MALSGISPVVVREEERHNRFLPAPTSGACLPAVAVSVLRSSRCRRLAPQPPLLRRRSASHRGLSSHRLSSSCVQNLGLMKQVADGNMLQLVTDRE
ncbi:hypothetical protein AAHA92_14400 [Salvia divinorum]|uniref:Uncharacterized protein n=1 Tax=Salvia divinorum TaxID=28513 RepID=A0ABD1HBF8_SALDI